MSSSNEGNVNDNSSPISKESLYKKRELRDLNTRLSMYVKTQMNSKKKIDDLIKQLKLQENEYELKLKDKQQEWNNFNNQLKRENESLNIQIKNIESANDTLKMTNNEYETKFEDYETFKNKQLTKIETLKHENRMIQSNLDKLRNDYGEIKFKYENFEKIKKDLLKQITLLKENLNNINADNIKYKTELKNNTNTYKLIIKDKDKIINELKNKILILSKDSDELRIKLTKEFDSKISEFMKKRDLQYKQEKEQWLKTCKEEFNRRLRSLNESNYDLTHETKQLNQAINDYKQRLSKLKSYKTELEILNRNNEEEIEKLRNQLDTTKKRKNDTIKVKNCIIADLREKYKLKEIEFNDMSSIKTQLSNEIDLYRKIMNDAEKEAGYISPLVNSNNKKKRKLNEIDVCNNNINTSKKRKKQSILLSASKNILNYFTSPGIIRNSGRQTNKIINNNDIIIDDEKDKENIDDNNNDNNNDIMDNDTDNNDDNDGDSDMDDDSDIDINNCDNYTTPGNDESSPLIFSDMDLNTSMIAIKNITNDDINLNGYTLTNFDKSKIYSLPDISLLSNDIITIYIGININYNNENININDNNCFIWNDNVWSGQTNDAARLYDINNNEIARIEIHPDMLPDNTKARCIVM